MKRLHEQDPLPIAQKVVDSGLLRVGGYPLSIACPKLVMTYIRNYHSNSHEVRGPNDIVIENIDTKMVTNVLQIPNREQGVDLSMQYGWEYF